jgi:hypothetical protein
VEACPQLADIVAKVFLGWRTKILRAADAFYARRREGPYRFIQNRSLASVVALKSDAAAEKSKDQLSRDFWGCSIFDFCNNISEQRTGSGSVEEPRAQVQIVKLPEAPQKLSANAETSSNEIRAETSPPDSKQARQSAQAMSPASPSKTATFIASKEVKRLRSRQGGSGSERSVEKRTLVVMTLRTIEFPDGRRVSQLIPYRNGARRMAFEAEE